MGIAMKPCFLQWVFFVCVAVLGAGQMLSACGNKGPLVLPGEESAPIGSVSNPQPPVQTPSEVKQAD